MELNMGEDQVGSLIYPRPLAGAGPTLRREFASLLRSMAMSHRPWYSPAFFRPKKAQRIMLLRQHPPTAGRHHDVREPNIRKSTIAWIDIQEDSGWLYEKVWQTFLAVNRWFKFDLLGFVDEIQFAKYSLGDRFGWHLDAGGGQTSTRKLSMSVQLCDDDEYAGGDLELCGLFAARTVRRRGTIIVFPSFLAHQVTPVTRGTRCSLVAWAHGPAFR